MQTLYLVRISKYMKSAVSETECVLDRTWAHFLTSFYHIFHLISLYFLPPFTTFSYLLLLHFPTSLYHIFLPLSTTFFHPLFPHFSTHFSHIFLPPLITFFLPPFTIFSYLPLPYFYLLLSHILPPFIIFFTSFHHIYYHL